MQRYNKITAKNPREILLLKSLPCTFGKCAFCNYILDNSTDLVEINQVNSVIIDQIDGEFGVVEIINSGSVFELPTSTLEAIREKVNQCKVHTLYFEVYYSYHKRLHTMREFFSHQDIRYCIGIETFDDEFRKRVFKKPFSTTNIKDLAEKFYVCNLLIGVQGQTCEHIQRDIELAQTHFNEIVINVFVDNTTAIKRDQALVDWFTETLYPSLKQETNIEILLDNKDFGVYVQ